MNSSVTINQYFDFMFAIEISFLSFQYQEKSSQYCLDAMKQTMNTCRFFITVT